MEDEDEDDEVDKQGRSDSSSSLTAGVKDIDIEGGCTGLPQNSSRPPSNGVQMERGKGVLTQDLPHFLSHNLYVFWTIPIASYECCLFVFWG